MKQGYEGKRLLWASELHSPICPFCGNELEETTGRERTEEVLNAVKEAERSRIARDLHDMVLQDLAYALRQVEAAQFYPSEKQMGTGLEGAIEALRRSLQGFRETVYELHPDGPRARPFVCHLKALLEKSRQMAPDLEIELVLEEEYPLRLPEATGRELAYIVQEALNNARRHSEARYVRVLLRADGDRVEAEIADDGRGFKPGATPGGLGLTTMRERAGALGGELEVRSEPGEGTRVLFRAPIPC
jgi:signal transduction histidine kinase